MYGHLLLQYKHVPNIPVKQEPIRPKIWHMFLQGRGCVGVVYFHVLLNMLGWYFIKGCVQQLNNHAVLNNKNPMPSVSIWPTNCKSTTFLYSIIHWFHFHGLWRGHYRHKGLLKVKRSRVIACHVGFLVLGHSHQQWNQNESIQYRTALKFGKNICTPLCK